MWPIFHILTAYSMLFIDKKYFLLLKDLMCSCFSFELLQVRGFLGRDIFFRGFTCAICLIYFCLSHLPYTLGIDIMGISKYWQWGGGWIKSMLKSNRLYMSHNLELSWIKRRKDRFVPCPRVIVTMWLHRLPPRQFEPA